jgi:hypothetical protein
MVVGSGEAAAADGSEAATAVGANCGLAVRVGRR